MKIESIIRRNGGTNVNFAADDRWPAGHYHFKPESTDPGAPHVCNVEVPEHVNRLLCIPEGYRVAASELGAGIIQPPKQVPTPAPVLAPTPAPADTVSGKTPPQAEDEPGDHPVFLEDIGKLRETSVRALKATINTYSKELLSAALAAEKGSEDPRKSWIEVVEAHLGA